MRRKTFKILLLLLLSGLLPMRGFARPRRAAAKAPARDSGRVATAHVRPRAGKSATPRKAGKASVAAAPRGRGTQRGSRGSQVKPGLEPVASRKSSRRVHASRGKAAQSRADRSQSLARAPGRERTRPASAPAASLAAATPPAAAPVAEPVPETHALPEVRVTHNRKQHLQAAPPVEGAGSPPAGPKPAAPEAALAPKARPKDFLTVGVANLGVPPLSAHPASDDAGLGLAPQSAEAGAPHGPALSHTPLSQGALLQGAPAPARVASALVALRKPAVVPVVEARERELLPPPVPMPALYTKSGRLIMPAALKGSHDILIHQNIMADHDGLERVQDDEDLLRMRQARLLVAIPDNAQMFADERLPANRRYARPWTVSFLNAIAKAHYAQFHVALQVNSAVRTVEFQARLMRTNGNAAPAEGDTASPHLTGQAIDIAKHGLSLTEIAWMRGYLMPLVQEGKIDVEEEFQQACFHISVYRKYMPQAAPERTITPHRTAGMALAAAIR